MKLIEVGFKALQADGSLDWELKDLLLDNFNLVVGRNATGKSLTLKVIEEFAMLIDHRTFTWGKNQLYRYYSFTFMNEQKDIFEYKVSVKNEPIVIFYERLEVNGKIKLDRNLEKGQLYSEVQKSMNLINPPQHMLVIQVRRDSVDYPFFEEIVFWAEHFKSYGFTNIIPLSNYGAVNSVPMHPTIILSVFLQRDDNQFKTSFIEDLNKIGFNISSIASQKFPDGTLTFNITENGLSKPINEHELSEGMFRALALLAFVYYLLDTKIPSTILIDDLAEGLDFNRATNLAQLLLEKTEKSNIQIIATTNDSYLMNAIPTHHWNILKRTGNVVNSYNYKNSKEIFEDFDFSGLNNFYLFTSDYLDKAIWKKEKSLSS
jgi:AAA15 family ATPase/GTPase